MTDTEQEPIARGPKGQFIKESGRWAPGESGNPGGRPKKPSLTAAVIRALNKSAEQSAKGVPLFKEPDGDDLALEMGPDGEQRRIQLRAPTIDELAMGVLELAQGGDQQALGTLKEIWERLDGRVADTLKIEVEVNRTMNAVESVCEEHERLDIYEQILERIASGGETAAQLAEAGSSEADG